MPLRNRASSDPDVCTAFVTRWSASTGPQAKRLSWALILPVVAMLPMTFSSMAGDGKDGLCVADFSGPLRTAVGGWYHVVGGRPDTVQDRLAPLGRSSDWAWHIDVLDAAPATGVAAVIPLHDNLNNAGLRGIHAKSGATLTLHLAGELVKRRLRIVATGPESARHVLRTLGAADLEQKAWRPISVDLADAGEGMLRELRLEFDGAGPASLWIRRIDGTGLAWEGREGLSASMSPKKLRRALWVWKTPKLLQDADNQKQLSAFCRRLQITDLFVQVPYTYDDGVVVVEHVDALHRFLRKARGTGLTVHALDGAPEYVLPAHHPRMFAMIEALDRFNKAGGDAARFDAVHLDNEPYILDDWKDLSRRQAIITAFVSLNRELRRRVNAADMVYGIDIPFWFDVVDDDGEPRFMVKSEGASRPLLDVLFECVQNVGIMSYRDRIIGPNGAVALCQREFELGRQNGVDVFAAIEVGRGPNVETGTTLGAYSKQYVASQIATMLRALAFQRGCCGLALHYYGGFQDLEK